MRNLLLGRPRVRLSLLFAAQCALLVAIGYIDVETGWQLSFSLFYLIPVGLGTATMGRWPGQVLALLGAVIWFVADNLHGLHYTSNMIAY